MIDLILVVDCNMHLRSVFFIYLEISLCNIYNIVNKVENIL